MLRYIYIVTIIILCQQKPYAQDREFPYSRSKTDWAILSVSLASTITSEFLLDERKNNLSVTEIGSLKRSSVNQFDRNATYNWSTSAGNFSDVPYRVMPFLPMALGIPLAANKKWDDAFTLGLIYTEVFFFTKGITGIIKTLAGRTRPYLYNTNFTPEERFALQQDAPTATTSFFSGHSSVTFAFAVLLSKTYTDIYGKNIWSKIIWVTSLSAATATAWARVEAGVHYPTDVIAGALIGSAIGYFIPEFHKTKNRKISVIINPAQFKVAYKL
jgi:membrane-associated phospholipid phosphatase